MARPGAATRTDPRTTRQDDDGADRGLTALRQATASYSEVRELLLEERALNTQLEQRAAQLTAARDAIARDHERALGMLTAVQRMHRALFDGSTWSHILQASLDIVDGERGYYVSHEPRGMRVRAAVDVPAIPGDAASPFIAGIAARVLETGEALRWTRSAPPDGLAPAADERFRQGLAVPVTMRDGPCGVIITLDRDGEFRDEDVRTLVTVGTEAAPVVENARLREELQHAYVSTIAMLADTLEVKDPYTRGHCEQVAHYARMAAEALGLSDEERRVACYAAMLHDVGKIGVSDGVLNKPGPLIPEERRLVEAHVRIGHDLLVGIPALRDVAAATLYHHEWYDGTGYPEGRSGDDIPIASRIVAVVDAYCAMLDKRSYKEAYPPARARDELRRCAGTQFDPRVVEVVLAAIETVDGDGAHHDGSAGCGILPVHRDFRTMPGIA